MTGLQRNAGDADPQLAVAAALAGAAVVCGMFGTALARFGKPGGDFATTADLEAERPSPPSSGLPGQRIRRAATVWR